MKDLLRKIHDALSPLYPPGEVRAITAMIFKQLKGWEPVDIVLHADSELGEATRAEIDRILERLKAREPIQYVLATARFYGLNLKVTPAVLIPRPETEELVEMIVRRAADRADLHVLDLCTGSGCIALALARHLRFPHITAADISADALAVARENAALLKTKVDFVAADALALASGPLASNRWDIIVSNPPYVLEKEKASMEANVLDYEPAQAIFVPDADPLRFYRAIAEYAATALVPGGQLFFEINPLTASDLCRLLSRLHFRDILTFADMQRHTRFLVATSPEKP